MRKIYLLLMSLLTIYTASSPASAMLSRAVRAIQQLSPSSRSFSQQPKPAKPVPSSINPLPQRVNSSDPTAKTAKAPQPPELSKLRQLIDKNNEKKLQAYLQNTSNAEEVQQNINRVENGTYNITAALKKNNVAIVRLLFSAGANLQKLIAENGEITPFGRALLAAKKNIISLFSLEFQAEIERLREYSSSQQKAPNVRLSKLRQLIDDGNEKELQEFLEEENEKTLEETINGQENDIYHLTFAIEKGNTPIIKLLLAHGAILKNLTFNSGKPTALGEALLQANDEIISLFTPADQESINALKVALTPKTDSDDRLDELRSVITGDDDDVLAPTVTSTKRANPAIEEWKPLVWQDLFDLRKIKNEKTSDIIAYLNQLKAENKLSIESSKIKDEIGDTLLHIAIQTNNLTLVKHLLVVYQAPIDIRNKKGQTPLITAILSDSPNQEIVTLLLRYNANVNSLDDDNKTVLDYAIKKEQSFRGPNQRQNRYTMLSIISLLLKKQAFCTLPENDIPWYVYNPEQLLTDETIKKVPYNKKDDEEKEDKESQEEEKEDKEQSKNDRFLVAIRESNRDTVINLIADGIDINKIYINEHILTPLILATEKHDANNQSSVTIFDILLEHPNQSSINTIITTKKGHKVCALDVAINRKDRHAIIKLIRAGAVENSQRKARIDDTIKKIIKEALAAQARAQQQVQPASSIATSPANNASNGGKAAAKIVKKAQAQGQSQQGATSATASSKVTQQQKQQPSQAAAVTKTEILEPKQPAPESIVRKKRPQKKHPSKFIPLQSPEIIPPELTTIVPREQAANANSAQNADQIPPQNGQEEPRIAVARPIELSEEPPLIQPIEEALLENNGINNDIESRPGENREEIRSQSLATISIATIAIMMAGCAAVDYMYTHADSIKKWCSKKVRWFSEQKNKFFNKKTKKVVIPEIKLI